VGVLSFYSGFLVVSSNLREKSLGCCREGKFFENLFGTKEHSRGKQFLASLLIACVEKRKTNLHPNHVSTQKCMNYK